MSRFNVGVNGYYGFATIYQEFGPWWALRLRRLALVLWLPDWTVPLIGSIRIRRDGERVTVAAYYGDSLSDFACFLVNKIFALTQRYVRERSIDVPLAGLIAAYGSDAPAYWREEWKRGTKLWKLQGPPDAGVRTVMRTADGPVVCACYSGGSQ